MSGKVGKTAAITVGLAGGYTAGHVMPLIAVAQAWRRLYPEDRLQCYGSNRGIEAGLLAAAGLPFQALPARPEQGVGPLGRLRAYAVAAHGMLSGRRLLRRAGTQLLLCFGGYASAGAGVAAASLGIPLAVFEANVLPGRTNDLLARFAMLKLAGMAEVRACPRWQDAEVVGLPLRRAAAWCESSDRDAHARRLLVTGGTFGSPFLNRNAPRLAALLAREAALEVYHQAGSGNEAEVRAAYRAAGLDAEVTGFDSALPGRWGWADVALCTAGAGTLAEALASAKPVVAVPLATAAGGHQEANAAAVGARHDLAWVREADWRAPREAARLTALLAGAGATVHRRDDAEDAAALLVHRLRGRFTAASGAEGYSLCPSAAGPIR